MASYTCISCRVAFADGEIQRAHYKTDWHRYNLKRKVADMPPVTAENFQERVLAQRTAVIEDGQAAWIGLERNQDTPQRQRTRTGTLERPVPGRYRRPYRQLIVYEFVDIACHQG